MGKFVHRDVAVHVAAVSESLNQDPVLQAARLLPGYASSALRAASQYYHPDEGDYNAWMAERAQEIQDEVTEARRSLKSRKSSQPHKQNR